MRYLKFILPLVGFLFVNSVSSQVTSGQSLETLDYNSPRTYKIAEITVSGTQNLDHSALIAIAGLEIGQEIEIPGEIISSTITNLWKQQLFTDVKISATKVQGELIFLALHVEERPRLSKYKFKGVKKGKQESLRDEINLTRGKVITANLINTTKQKIKEYYIDKGYFNTEIEIDEETDTTLRNTKVLTIKVNPKQRVKIEDILIEGNEIFTDKKIQRFLKNTKKARITGLFKPSKYIKSNFKKDKKGIIAKYNALGYRDAKVSFDTLYKISENRIMMEMIFSEGKQYYFGDLKWIGNTKYSNSDLDRILGIKRGDLFNQELFDQRIYQDQNGRDISSLYLDDGYLFFQPNVVETQVRGDTIDFEIRLREGQQARINEVRIIGNTKTNDHVIRRELRTNPGDLFSRADIIRSQRELMQLGYFNQEKNGN